MSSSCPGPGGDRDVMQLQGVQVDGEEPGFGGVIRASGDIDGDGRNELVLGSHEYGMYYVPGAVHILR